ncbi:MAG: MmcQ/YjbR family DNA-binding protein [Sandaracinus sp.]
MTRTPSTDPILRALRARGLTYPGAHLKSPWPGHLDLAVNDKTFAYLSIEGEPLKVSCKLPESAAVALLLPFCEPTAYGLGRSGWVSARFDADADVPVEMLEAWIDESYRAQAPKKLLAQLDSAAKAPKAVAKAPKAVAKAPKASAKAPKPAAKAPKTVAKASKGNTKARKAVAKAPQGNTKAPKAVAKAPKTVANLPGATGAGRPGRPSEAEPHRTSR